mgnify:CR=1 FL=1
MRFLVAAAVLLTLTSCAQPAPTLEGAIARCATETVAAYLEQYPDDDTPAADLLELATEQCRQDSTTDENFLTTWSS